MTGKDKVVSRDNISGRSGGVSRPSAETEAALVILVPPNAPRPHVGYAVERGAYARLKPGLLKTSPGRFVVFVGDEMTGPYDEFRAAYIAGRRRFGPGPLYIRQVLSEEPIFEPVGLDSCPS